MKNELLKDAGESRANGIDLPFGLASDHATQLAEALERRLLDIAQLRPALDCRFLFAQSLGLGCRASSSAVATVR